MAPKVYMFRQLFIIKTPGWVNMSGKLGSIIRDGLAKPRKMITLATPPPWFGNPDALSPAQKAVNQEFAKIQRQYAGLPLKERIIATKKALKGRSFGGGAVRRPAAARTTPARTPARRATAEVVEVTE